MLRHQYQATSHCLLPACPPACCHPLPPTHLSIGRLPLAVHVTRCIHVHLELQRLPLLLADHRQALQLDIVEQPGKERAPLGAGLEHHRRLLPVLLQELGAVLRQHRGSRIWVPHLSTSFL